MTNDPQAPQFILTCENLDRDTGHKIAGALESLVEPAPTAVSIFQDRTGWRVDGYFSHREAAETAGQNLTAIYSQGGADGVKAAIGAASITPVPDLNWVTISQAALPPVQAGRFTICGHHDLSRVPSGPGTLVVEAGEAFGTAHHATTFGCLLAIDRLTRRRAYRNVLDLGTGSGVLALALRRALPGAKILGTDIDAVSIDVAQKNARRNSARSDADARLTFLIADGFADHRLRARGPFDMVIANILAGPIMALAPQLASHIAPGGTVVLSGILNDQAREIIARYRSLGFDMTAHTRLEGWSTLTMSRRASRSSTHGVGRRAFNLYAVDHD